MMEEIKFYAALSTLVLGPLIVILSMLMILVGATIGATAMVVIAILTLIVGSVMTAYPYYWFIVAT